jgi:hypothetical protein
LKDTWCDMVEIVRAERIPEMERDAQLWDDTPPPVELKIPQEPWYADFLRHHDVQRENKYVNYPEEPSDEPLDMSADTSQDQHDGICDCGDDEPSWKYASQARSRDDESWFDQFGCRKKPKIQAKQFDGVVIDNTCIERQKYFPTNVVELD